MPTPIACQAPANQDLVRLGFKNFPERNEPRKDLRDPPPVGSVFPRYIAKGYQQLQLWEPWPMSLQLETVPEAFRIQQAPNLGVNRPGSTLFAPVPMRLGVGAANAQSYSQGNRKGNGLLAALRRAGGTFW